MTTINDIARISGVGSSTVSRVLNGGKNVKQETVDKVLAVVKELNYKPNTAARSLKRGSFSVNSIGVILPNIAHPFWFEIVRGVYETLSKLEYNLQIFNRNSDMKDLLGLITEEKLAGVLIFASALTDEEKKILKLSNVNYLFVDYNDNTETSIYLDNKFGGKLAAQYLLSKGISNIAYIGDDEKHLIQEERLQGFKKELSKNNILSITDVYIPLNSNDAYKVTKSLIKDRNVEGFFYFCDQLAYDGLMAIKELQSKTYAIGYDDMRSSFYLGLTTIKQPAFKIGSIATKSIIKMLKDNTQKIKSICIKPKLVERNT